MVFYIASAIFTKKREAFMRRILSLLLVLVLISSSAIALFSCTDMTPPHGDAPPVTENGGDNKPQEDDYSKLVVPQYKDYNRGTIDFSKIEYSRPNADEVITSISSVTEQIKKNELPLNQQILLIEDLEDDFSNFLTMYSYSNIMNSKDSSNEDWSDEFSYMSKAYPSFSKAVEDLLVAAAQSENAEGFEEEYFGEGFIDTYKDGGKYTDKLVSLMEEESELESRYSALSTDNVLITYKTFEDKTFDEIIEFYATNYGTDSVSYQSAYEECMLLYQEAANKISVEILVELFKVRREISDELSYDSYAKLAYEELYHDYTEKELLSFISDIKNYIIPVYVTAKNYVFSNYFDNHEQTDGVTKTKLINDMYSIVYGLDSDIADIFNYMLQHELYDAEPIASNRFDGSFVTYLDDYSAPYLFVSTEETTSDYMAFAHEFGHFIDNYVNYGSSTSLDLSEVSSTAFEWIVLEELKSKLSHEDIRYLTYLKYMSSMEVFIYQGFYALFEHYAYQLEEGNISEHTLTLALQKAAHDMGLNADAINSLEFVTIPHIMLYPFYVQSYCVSEAISLDIYLSNKDTESGAISVYKTLLARNEVLDLEGYLEAAKITSPFKKNQMRNIADAIHYQIFGSHYFKGNGDDITQVVF